MVLDKESINKHLELLRGYVSDLKKYRKEINLKELKRDRSKQYMVLHPLVLSIQSCIDIANHIISEGSLRRPEEAGEVFRILAEENILPTEFSERLERMAKFRNLAMHIYWKIEIEKVYKIIRENLDDFNKFEKYIIEYVERDS